MKLTPKQMRKAMDKSREATASYLGIHPNTLDKLEDEPSKFTWEQGKKLAELFECSLDDLIFLP